MKLAICLISADRYDYTKRTVESFCDHNTRLLEHPDIDLFHADDASSDDRVRRLAQSSGFQLVAGTKFGKPRRGGQAMRHDVINFAHKKGNTAVLLLENDWESVRPLPFETIARVMEGHNVYTMRLYGQYKERDEDGNGRRACGKTHYGKGRSTFDPGWLPLVGFEEKLEIGDIHWGAPPAVTKIKQAVWLHDGTRSEGQIRHKCAKLEELTVRVVDNVFFHIGGDRTPGFKQ